MSTRKFCLLSFLTLVAVAASTVRLQGQECSPSDLAFLNAEPGCGCPAPCEDGCGDACTCNQPCRSANCGKGRGPDKVCCSTVEEVTEERSCWKIECEEICVPRIVCPWGEGGSGLTLFNCFKNRGGSKAGCGDCCSSCGDTCGTGCCGNGCGNGDCCGGGCCITPRCGDVRCVRDLASEDYEVTKCKCKWDIKEGCCGSDCCGGCGCGGCGCGNEWGTGCGCGDTCGAACGSCVSSTQPAQPKPQASIPARENLAKAFAIRTVSGEQPVAGEGAASSTTAAEQATPEQPSQKQSLRERWFGTK